MPFQSAFIPSRGDEKEELWFILQGQNLLIKATEQGVIIPSSRDVADIERRLVSPQFLGYLDGKPCHAAEYPKEQAVSAPFCFKSPLALIGRLDDELVWIAGLANQLVYWNGNHHYCGKCGSLTENKTDERAKICPKCGLVNFPRLSPAVIVAVIKDDRILLASSARFKANFYSVLAGFVEPGETLEECVKREVREEVDIEVKNIRYFGSQPWPFPDSLMIGFTSEYAGGEINLDNTELLDAAWFGADNLPPVPARISIARQLIDWFSERNGKKKIGTRP
ncbi:MAG: NAD(+) diphosphatase [Pseudomonadota bacterium]